VGESMPRGTRNEDTTLLSMALLGFEVEKKRIEEKIAELRARVGGHPVPSTAKGSAQAATPSGRKPLSAAARKRIAAAQKKRWAEHRKKQAAAAE
jgi:hypothetical protein